MCPRALEYIEGVLSGKIVVGELMRLCVERHVKDLETGPERGLVFSPSHAQHSIDFIELFCRHSKGEWAGSPLRLEPWQCFIQWLVFGWLREDGTRRFRTAITTVARKNGKSTWTAGLGLYGLLGDGEPGAEVYSAATTREQAIIVHSEAVRMVQRSPHLKSRIEVVKNNLSVPANYSKFEPLSADYNTLDGLNIHFGIIDELHAHKTRGVFDVLDTGTGARKQPLIWAITTAGVSWAESICLELLTYGEKILRGSVEDDTFFCATFAADKDDDWQDEAIWPKANPSLGVSVKLDDLRRKALRAKETPSAQNNFKTKHLNIWCAQTSAWLSVEQWQRGQSELSLGEFEGEDCFIGVDLASTQDVTAACLLFEHEAGFAAFWRYWVPTDTAQKRTRTDAAKYDEWCRQGVITATPGAVVDYDYIRRDIAEFMQLFNVREIAIDRWNATQFATQMDNEGWPAVMVGQGFASMSGPSKELEKLVVGGQIKHLGDPVTKWMIGNVAIKTDSAGNIKPCKASSTGKIDGVVALIMALGRAVAQKNTRSVYEDRGVLEL